MSELVSFDRLLANYLDGTATPQEVDQLGELLLSEAKYGERASEMSLLHYHVGELFDEQQFHALLDHYSGSRRRLPEAFSARSSTETSAGRVSSFPRSGFFNSWPKRFGWLAAACVLLVFTLLAVDSLYSPGEESTAVVLDSPPDAQPRSESVATVTQLAEVAWSEGAPIFVPGQPLAPESRIRFESGLAKLTFECGAEVVLEGPCDFMVRDAMVGVLHQGKITANVPRRAFAFAILSPGVDFIDVGTSFGLSVDDTGNSELHVFEGEVLYNNSNRPAQSERNPAVHVMEKQAVGFAAGNPETIVFDEKQFSPLLAFRKARTLHDPPPVAGDLALWLAADTGISTDPEGRLVAWQDIVTNDNRSGEDATQSDEVARPEWLADAIHDRAAVRFNGTSDYLITTPLETTDNQTVFLVIQYSEQAFSSDRQWGGQILNYDGPPSREASNTFAPGILQIGEPLLAEEFQPSLLTAQVFAGFIGSAVVESGRVDAQPLGVNKPAVVCYRYEYTEGESQMWINGKVYGQARAFAPQALTSRKIIGRHAWKELYFGGDLGELLIYNRALPETEVEAITTHLADKYRIELETDHSAN